MEAAGASLGSREATPERKGRRAVLVRRAALPREPGSPTQSPKPRHVLVARRLDEGQTIHLHGSPGKVTYPRSNSYDREVSPEPQSRATTMVTKVPETLASPVRGRSPRPKRPHGRPLEKRDLIGTKEEFQDSLRRAGTGQQKDIPLWMTESDEASEGGPIAENSSADQTSERRTTRVRIKESPGMAKERHNRDNHMDRDTRALLRWEETNREWAAFKRRVSRRLGKGLEELVISRSERYRETLEQYDLIQRALPVKERNTDDVWLMSLRNNWTRYVTLGNIFSGLYCPVHANPHKHADKQATIRKTVDDDASTTHVDASVMTMSKSLRQKLEEMSHLISRVQPHDVEFPGLVVRGRSVDDSPARSSTGRPEIDFEKDTEPADAQATLTHSQTASSMQSGALASDTVAESSALPSNAQRASRGPHAIIDRRSVGVTCPPGDDRTCAFCVHNTGSTVLFFEWHHESPELVSKLGKSAGARLSSRRFVCGNAKGHMLPGERRTFHFTVHALPSEHGSFSEVVRFETTPALPLEERISVSLTAFIPERIGVNGEEDKLEMELVQHERHYLCREIVDDVFRSWEPPAPTTPLPYELWFVSRNADVLYSQEVFHAFVSVKESLEDSVWLANGQNPAALRRRTYLTDKAREGCPREPLWNCDIQQLRRDIDASSLSPALKQRLRILHAAADTRARLPVHPGKENILFTILRGLLDDVVDGVWDGLVDRLAEDEGVSAELLMRQRSFYRSHINNTERVAFPTEESRVETSAESEEAMARLVSRLPAVPQDWDSRDPAGMESEATEFAARESAASALEGAAATRDESDKKRKPRGKGKRQPGKGANHDAQSAKDSGGSQGKSAGAPNHPPHKEALFQSTRDLLASAIDRALEFVEVADREARAGAVGAAAVHSADDGSSALESVQAHEETG